VTLESLESTFLNIGVYPNIIFRGMDRLLRGERATEFFASSNAQANVTVFKMARTPNSPTNLFFRIGRFHALFLLQCIQSGGNLVTIGHLKTVSFTSSSRVNFDLSTCPLQRLPHLQNDTLCIVPVPKLPALASIRELKHVQASSSNKNNKNLVFAPPAGIGLPSPAIRHWSCPCAPVMKRPVHQSNKLRMNSLKK
jgi:hypothetical protein